MIISKEIAAKIANELVAKKQEKIKQLDAELSVIGNVLAKTTVNVGIWDMFKKHPKYFSTSDTLMVSGTGLSREQIKIDPCPVKDNEWYIMKQVDDKVAARIYKIVTAKSKLSKEVKELRDQIYHALLNLKTYSRIKSEFSEAAPFLPNEQNNAVTVNLDQIRKKL